MKSDNQNSKPIALYARVSTNRQESALQLDALRSYASRLGIEAREYVDEGFSGAQAKRPALSKLMADARLHEIGRVVVWKLDRLCRSLRHLLECLEEFEALGIEFASITESFDTSTPAGRLLFQVVGALGEFERSLLRERVKAGMAASKQRLEAGPYRRKDGKLVRHIGRPRVDVDVERARTLLAQRIRLKAVAAYLGVHPSTLRLRLAQNPPAVPQP